MFFVLNKQKIIAYGVSVLTVVFLFCIASGINENKETIETSANNQKLLPIYNVETTENKVAFTMNCAWNADDIDKILEVSSEPWVRDRVYAKIIDKMKKDGIIKHI